MIKNVKRAQVVLRLVWESVRFAVSSLKTDRLRTLLSLLGITVGIFTIVLVLSIINGLKENIRVGLNSLDGDVITVQREPWEISQEGEWNMWKYIRRPPIDIRDYEFVSQHLDIPSSQTFFTTFQKGVYYTNKSYKGGEIVSVKGDFDKLFIFDTAYGRWFSPLESNGYMNICYIGGDISRSLFGETSPIGKVLKIGEFPATVIGVAAPQGESIAHIFDFDHSVFVPYGFGERISGEGSGGAIAMCAHNQERQQELIDQTRVLMRSHRRLSPETEDNFSINKMDYLSWAVDDVFRSINTAGWIIGGFALLIGAFGIANILFVSVQERVPQIGVQKALGAWNYIIIAQFLSEAALLSVVGGALGILLVMIISLILGNNSGIPFDLSVTSTMEGVAIALIVGILAGIMPAYKASRMDPVKAINNL